MNGMEPPAVLPPLQQVAFGQGDRFLQGELKPHARVGAPA